MTKDQLDKFILCFVWGIATVVCVLNMTVTILQQDREFDSLKHQTTVQQNKIDKQQREISRLEQTNKALANQAKGE